MLRQTLENFAELDMSLLTVEFVIVDNNSADNTREIVEIFKDRLPLVYLFEPKPGKNCALNKALDEIALGDLVIFTDDDVKPNKDWFKKIIEVSEKWPSIDVFGGKVGMEWPPDSPKCYKQLEKIIYAQHDYGEEEKLYENRVTPIGPNYWVRSKLFKSGERFNESFGPTPDHRKRIMGSEASFLLGLIDKGYSIVYSPDVFVGHYVTKEQQDIRYLRSRAASLGRWAAAGTEKFKRRRLYERYPFVWKATIYYSLLRLHFLLYLSTLNLNKNARVKKEVFLNIWIAYFSHYLNNHEDIYRYANSLGSNSVHNCRPEKASMN